MKQRPDLALAFLRVVVGLIILWHGYQTIFVQGLNAVTAQFRAGGLPLPLLLAPLAAVLQLVGGALLILGLGVRGLAGALALVTLLPVLALLRGEVQFSRLEAPLLLLTGCLALMFGGPGHPSLESFRLPSQSEAPPLPVKKKSKKKG